MHEKLVTVAKRNYRRPAWPHRLLARGLDLVVLAIFGTIAGTTWLALIVTVAIVYFAVGDGLLAGRNIGKRLTGLKVIETRHGGPCTLIQDFIRHRYVLLDR